MAVGRVRTCNQGNDIPESIPHDQAAINFNWIVDFIIVGFKLALIITDGCPYLISNMHSYEGFPESEMRKMLYLYVPPVLIIIGTLGNTFSFIILRRKQMLKVSSYLYLASLAVIDTFVLYNGLLVIWVQELGYHMRNWSDWLCKPLVTLGYVASDFSVWLIIAVTVERYIVVCFPFQASSMCNLSRAKKVIVGIFFIMLALNFHFFWTVEIDTLHDRCMPAKQHIRLVTEIWPWVDTLIYSLIPFLTITVLNIFIIKEVAGARSNRMLLSGSENDNYILATNHRNSNVANQRRSNQNEGSRLTALLLTVSFTFLVLTLPFNIVMIITRLWNDTSGKNNELQSMAQFQLIQAITELLMYTNHSVNFFLYCATGHKFRQQILDLFRCLYRRQARGSNNTTLTNAQSIRRNSQSVISGGGEVMVVLRSDQSRGSSLSLNMKDDLNETDHDTGHVSSVKSCSGKSYSSRGSLFKSDSSLNSSACMNPCNGKSRTFVGNSRNSETFFSKRDSSMRACYGFYRSQSSQEHQKHETVQNGTHKRVPKTNNNASCKIFYSSKKHKPSPLTLSRSSFGSLEDCSLKDREYIVLQPTIRWCEASVQS